MELIWLRKDLRIHDHAPLQAALASGDPAAAAFVFDRRQEERTEAGFIRMDEKRERFLVEGLLEMHQQAGRIGVPLLLSSGDPVQEIRTWCQEYPVKHIRAYRLSGTEETDDEKAVQQLAEEMGVQVTWYEGETLLYSEDLPFSSLPKSFTGFRKKVEQADLQPAPEAEFPQEQAPMFLEEHADSGEELMRRYRDNRSETLVRGGEVEALRRLRQYLFESRDVLEYKERRNGMLVFNDSSKLSPWLAQGSLSPRRLYRELKRFEEEVEANESTYWLWFELLWRDYFHFLLKEHGSRLFAASGIQSLPVEWSREAELFHVWCDGETGYPLVDAAMKELQATGYMSNRARQNTASFLTKNLGIDWRWGAAWFESHLIDYDPASNYGNWQYVAGIGTDMREFRAFHVVKQGKRYDAKGNFVRRWLPALQFVPDKYIYEPYLMSESERGEAALELGSDYPYPVVPLEESLDKQKTVFEAARKQKKGAIS
ncbi:DASH family cryptochrome [Alkalicoccus urumqiensis]|uniref:Cryptochrome DASH n=1 Tax=Alkalicoccus urumqiensis TaxID=1548213 RepID=A0A2P6ML64_ALKUR|nr:DASH family cryptochrome [Alkalicoccus urumqiensis]PRO67018.1 cryptochrome DASH [Alkalicoccus urumqiensis]